MATSLEESEKVDLIKKNSRKYLPFGEKIVKIGPVNTEIALLRVKKKKKLQRVKYIARSASLPSGLNNPATSCTYLVNFRPIISEFTLLKRAIFSAIRPQFDDDLQSSPMRSKTDWKIAILISAE